MNFKMQIVGCVLAFGIVSSLPAATYRTTNFEVTADTDAVAEEIARSAEEWRTDLAKYWLQRPLKKWNYLCRIEVSSQKTGGTGWTTYQFLGGRVIRVGIELQGPLERLLEYVLPHELTHAVLVTELGEAMPRWADEGAAMLSESQSQKIRQKLLVEQLIRTGDIIPFRQMLHMIDYPPNKAKLHAFYAQSLALSEFLISRGGRPRFLQFVSDGQAGEWDVALHRHYKLESVEVLQGAWSEWVMKKNGNRDKHDSQQILASE